MPNNPYFPILMDCISDGKRPTATSQEFYKGLSYQEPFFSFFKYQYFYYKLPYFLNENFFFL
jgi:hypothetical protein